MTPERERLLEAQAAMARAFHTLCLTTTERAPRETPEHFAERQGAQLLDRMRSLPEADRNAIIATLRAHDAASPAQQVGETVEVRGNVWRNRHNGKLDIVDAETDDVTDNTEHWQFLATITARVPLPVVPVIVADVEESR